MIGRLGNVIRYRELLGNLVRKELKVKYKNSLLGFVWSMLNPALYLVIFTVVFTVFLKASIPYFSVFLLAGLLPWNLFSSALQAATGSIVFNANLVTKVHFPREVLPLASIGAALVHFGLQFAVLAAALVLFRYPLDPGALWLLPAGLLVEVLTLVALCLLVGACNVFFRDLQHLLDLLLLAWFWLTPIVYPVALVIERMGGSGLERLALSAYLLNPMTAVVLSFQRAVYGRTTADGSPILADASLGWYFTRLGLIAAVALVLIGLAWAVFGRLEDSFAEEL